MEIFKGVTDPTCPFGQFVYDAPLCCLKRDSSKPYCNKFDCPKDKGIMKCKPVPKLCDYCPTNPKNKITSHVIV